MTCIEAIARIVFVGIGATAVMDLWLVILKRIGVPTMNFSLIGRWTAHLFRGRFIHPSIGGAVPVRGELALGWLTHYTVGIAFAGLLFGVQGAGWMREPSMVPALAVGLCTVAAPLFVMQPAMGLGVAASKTPTPFKNCMRSMMNHAVFGLGLYLSALVVRRMFE